MKTDKWGNPIHEYRFTILVDGQTQIVSHSGTLLSRAEQKVYKKFPSAEITKKEKRKNGEFSEFGSCNL